ALLAPEWVPWSERLRPGDLGPGDLLPAELDDWRLVPSYVASDDPAVEEVAFEVGLGRARVLSREARLDAAERWYASDGGPEAAIMATEPAVERQQHHEAREPDRRADGDDAPAVDLHGFGRRPQRPLLPHDAGG